MIEQEKREKAIDKMAQTLCGEKEQSCAECKGSSDTYCGGRVSMERLYDVGYRRAQEIFAKCKEKCMFEGYPYGIDYTELVEVFKDFGVEVEE